MRTCKYFVLRKKRFCRLFAADNSQYCVHHLMESECAESDRVHCPYNPKHNILKSRLKKHLHVCPNKKVATEGFSNRINSAINDGISKHANLPVATQRDILNFIQKLNSLDKKLGLTENVKSFPSSPFEEIIQLALHNPRHWSVNGFPGAVNSSDSKQKASAGTAPDPSSNEVAAPVPDSRGSQRHTYQNGCLINVLKASNLLSTDFTYVEFGAGRGGLSHWVNLCLTSKDQQNRRFLMEDNCYPPTPVDTHFVLVELRGLRYKFDIRHREAGNFVRLRMDIADLDLNTVPAVSQQPKPIVALAKHLCGDATDLALRCLKNGMCTKEAPDTANRIGGILFATCCHHQCTWEEAVGRPWLESEAGLKADEFAIASRLTSWATCGFKRILKHTDGTDKSEATVEEKKPSLEQDHPSPAAQLASDNDEGDIDKLEPEERIRIGRLCKQLIDWSRMCYVRHELNFPDVSMYAYTSVDVTPENIVIVASRSAPS
ncbi:unnamed protein product [Calicophoron daubneyi]|uniref:tRNA:m(4)X modification enzyme TRM13 n=1 Tax=Calicophoron daubneyi TaxID=300641 RepID=A0AAV2T326_CALDB